MEFYRNNAHGDGNEDMSNPQRQEEFCLPERDVSAMNCQERTRQLVRGQDLSCSNHLLYEHSCLSCKSINSFFSPHDCNIHGDINPQQVTLTGSSTYNCDPINQVALPIGTVCGSHPKMLPKYSKTSEKDDTQRSIITFTEKGEMVYLQYPDGRLAFVEDTRFPGLRIGPLQVLFAPGYSIESFRHETYNGVHMLVDNGPEFKRIIYVGRVGLLGGWGNKEHKCDDHPMYECRDCGFACPKKNCVVCCTHKDHNCDQQQKIQRQTALQRMEMQRQEFQTQLQNQMNKVDQFIENVAVAEDALDELDLEDEIESSRGAVFFEASGVDVGEEAFEICDLGSLSDESNQEFIPKVLKFPRMKSSFQSTLSQGSSLISEVIAIDSLNKTYATDNTLIAKLKRMMNSNEESHENSLLQQIINHTNSDSLSEEKFNFLWSKIKEIHTNIAQRLQFLQLLFSYKVECSLPLACVCNVVSLALKIDNHEFSLAYSKQDNFFQLKMHWINQNSKMHLQFPIDKQTDLLTAMSQCFWGPEVSDIFVRYSTNEKCVDDVLEFISMIRRFNVPDAIVLATIMTDTQADKRGSKIESWVKNIMYQILCNSINLDVNNDPSPSVHNLMQQSLSPQIVFKVLHNNKHNTKLFMQVTKVLSNYQVGKELSEEVMQIMTLPFVNDCLTRIDRSIVRKIFGDPYEYSLDDLVSGIIKKPDKFESCYNNKLKDMYNDVINKFRRKLDISTEDPRLKDLEIFNLPIIAWEQKHVKLWTDIIQKQIVPFCLLEAIAVLIQVVKIIDGTIIRPVQILSLLLLLHAETDRGRLAQINTGEGKSLIVAMLAAVHALQGKKVDIVTTSHALAKREVQERKKFFDMFSLSVSENCYSSSKSAFDTRRKTGSVSEVQRKLNAYKSHVLYGTASDFMGDILRKEFQGNDLRCEREYHVIIVDEVDSMLFDSRTFSVRLSQSIPGMNYLEPLLGVIWESIHRIAHQIIEINNKTYYILDQFEVIGNQIALKSGERWDNVAHEVENKKEFISEETQKHIQKLIRELPDCDRKDYENFQKIQHKISEERDKQIGNDNIISENLEALLQEEKNCPWNTGDNYAVIEIPKHLRKFAMHQIPYWVKNAIDAACVYKRDAHYVVENDRIVPINVDENGELQTFLVWSDGLTQFLQINEGLPVDAENICTNYLSHVSFFKRYGHNIFGVTGTLGEETTQNFLSNIYDIDMVFVPPHRSRKILDNQSLEYLCKELTPIVVKEEDDWYSKILTHGLYHANMGRAVLIICKYIFQVEKLVKHFKSHSNTCKVKAYTGQNILRTYDVDTGDIIVATNIAGRGTDLKTTDAVEINGGLYVAVTFLPSSYRVEMQNIGRTARQGKKGMAQLILCDPQGTDITLLRKRRQRREKRQCKQAECDVQRMITLDNLFKDFCCLENKLLPSHNDCELESKWSTLQSKWRDYKEKHSQTLEEKLLEFRKRLKNDMKRCHVERSDSRVDQTSFEQVFEKEFESQKSANKEKLDKKLLESFCINQIDKFPDILLQCLRNGQQFESKKSESATQYNWGAFERQSLEERWGLWLRSKHFESQAKYENFPILFQKEFAEVIEANAIEDTLVENPYYYVLKGNEIYRTALLEPRINVVKRNNLLNLAIKIYDRAIELDPVFSAHARYNKACALLSYQWNAHFQDKAFKELEIARDIINNTLRPTLLAYNAWITQTGEKLKTTKHIQHQLNVLGQEETFIDNTMKILKSAEKSEVHVMITLIPIKKSFSKYDEDHSKAIRREMANGLTHFFWIKELPPIAWGNIIALSSIGVTEIVCGSLLTVFTGSILGPALIAEGVQDLVTAVACGFGGTFSWAKWALLKTASLCLSVVSAGIKGITSTFKAAKDVMMVIKENPSACLMIAGKTIKTCVVDLVNGNRALSKCISEAEKWSAERSACECYEKIVVNAVRSEIHRVLLNHTILKNAIKADKRSGNDYWQNFLIKEAEKLINGMFSVPIQGVQSLLQDILKTVVNNAQAPLGILHDNLSKSIQELMTDLLNEYNKLINQCDRQINMAIKTTKEEEEAEGEEEEEEEEEEKDGVHFEETKRCDNDESLNCDGLRNITYSKGKEDMATRRMSKSFGCPPEETFINQLTREVSQKLCQNVRSQVLVQCCSEDANVILKGINESLNEIKNTSRRALINRDDLLDISDIDQLSDEDYQDVQSESSDPTEFSSDMQALIERLRKEIPLSRAMLKLFASVLETPILMFETEYGKLIHIEGEQFNSRPIMLKVIPQSDTQCERCVPLDDSIIKGNSRGNGFIDALWAQVNPLLKDSIGNVENLKDKIIERIKDDPWNANHLFGSNNSPPRVVSEI